MTGRLGDWITTYSGRTFYPCDPIADEIHIEDIAHALSMTCRFTGHCREFYSVSQHSFMASYIVPPEDAKWGLLHDASEAFLADVSRPVKPYLENYIDLERQLMRVIAKRFDLPWPMPPSIKHADDVLVCTERRDLLNPGPDWGDWTKDVPLLDDKIIPLCPFAAKMAFLSRFKELFGE